MRCGSRLVDGTDEILNWVDDHHRYLFSATVHEPVTGDDEVAVFLDPVGHTAASLDADRGMEVSV
jgi:hypothetical protein